MAERPSFNDPPVVEWHGNIAVVRDDLHPGGSKTRFLPALIGNAKEIVFGGPRCGGAPVALAYIGRQLGRRITLFYAESKELHRRQRQAKLWGATLHSVPMGYITNVQAKARTYAEKAGALFFPLGFDLPAAEAPYVEAMRSVRTKIGGDPDEVWCACASGMLTRCLGLAFPNSEVKGVVVGLKSRHSKQAFTSNVTLLQHPIKDLGTPCKVRAPFPICSHYEAKAWQFAQQSRKRAVFWNVIGR